MKNVWKQSIYLFQIWDRWRKPVFVDGGKKKKRVRVNTSLAAPEGFSPPWAIIQKCKSPFCMKSGALSEFRIAKEVWCFDSNLGIKENYENRPLCPEGTYFLKKGRRRQKSLCVSVCVCDSAWPHTCCTLHFAYIKIHFCIRSVCLFPFFSAFWWRWKSGCSRSSGFWAGIHSISGLQSWKLGRNGALWAIKYCGSLNPNLPLGAALAPSLSVKIRNGEVISTVVQTQTHTYRHQSQNRNSNALNVHS